MATPNWKLHNYEDKKHLDVYDGDMVNGTGQGFGRLTTLKKNNYIIINKVRK